MLSRNEHQGLNVSLDKKQRTILKIIEETESIVYSTDAGGEIAVETTRSKRELKPEKVS